MISPCDCSLGVGVDAAPAFVVLVGKENDAVDFAEAVHAPGCVGEEFKGGLGAHTWQVESTYDTIDLGLLVGIPFLGSSRSFQPATGWQFPEAVLAEGILRLLGDSLLHDKIHLAQIIRPECEVGEGTGVGT